MLLLKKIFLTIQLVIVNLLLLPFTLIGIFLSFFKTNNNIIIKENDPRYQDFVRFKQLQNECKQLVSDLRLLSYNYLKDKTVTSYNSYTNCMKECKTKLREYIELEKKLNLPADFVIRKLYKEIKQQV